LGEAGLPNGKALKTASYDPDDFSGLDMCGCFLNGLVKSACTFDSIETVAKQDEDYGNMHFATNLGTTIRALNALWSVRANSFCPPLNY